MAQPRSSPPTRHLLACGTSSCLSPETGQEGLPASRHFVRVGLAAAGQAESMTRRLQGTPQRGADRAEG